MDSPVALFTFVVIPGGSEFGRAIKPQPWKLIALVTANIVIARHRAPLISIALSNAGLGVRASVFVK